MEPRIQYAKSKDGVSIAYWTIGEGQPIVSVPFIVSHIQLEWHWPNFRNWYESLAENRKLIRYDIRGSGLSEREVTDYSLEAHVRDLEAVVDRLELQSFALFASLAAGPIVVAYAVRHPERVSHMMLWCSFASGSDLLLRSPQVNALRSLLDKDFELWTETVSHVAFGWSAGKEARRFAAFIRECASAESIRAALRASDKFDVRADLPSVQSPTLVIHRREVPYPNVALARELASAIPNASLTVLEGTTIAPWENEEEVLTVVDEFLGEGEEAAATAALPVGDIHTILFTDVEGSTALTQRLGDAKARELLRVHERMVREALKAHGGSEVKTMGDGFMASFSSATGALECAIAMQRAFAEWNEGSLRSKGSPSTSSGRTVGEGSGRAEEIRVRIGLNAGEPIAEDDDLFGTAVNLAARIAAEAEAGAILASDVVRQLVAGKDFLFADRGETSLKGFDEPVRLYEVRWREEG